MADSLDKTLTDGGRTDDVIDTVEIERLCGVVQDVYGYDFSGYQPAFLRRRLRRLVATSHTEGGVAGFTARIASEPQLFADFVAALALSVTEMFRDPGFFCALRTHVLPQLRTYPFVRVWAAGCATGQEAFSLAILLEEEGMGGRYQLYGTDIHAGSLARARSGVMPATEMATYTRNYQRAGGTRTFSDYYTCADGYAIIRPQWRENIVFARHNLVSDSKFNEFNLILCRNVLIYFNRDLHSHVHKLLYGSLASFGFLGLGTRESLRFSPQAENFTVVDHPHRLYRKRR